MIPRKLSLEGVYSYREKQTIDFQSLTGGGIFGIFGPVGSGKSAILESMTYALYGQIERLSQTEQRGYNMMNLQSDRMFIDFEFSHEKSLYRFTVSAKRQKKNFDVISTPERQGYRRNGEEWIPLEDQNIRGGVTAESLLGLSYEHFRRTVIIPQGKFQEFIQLTPSQRTGMIESLFNLEKFNLYGKSASLLSKVRSDRAFQQGRMEELEKFRTEDLTRLDQELQILRNELKTLETRLIQQKEEFKVLEESSALYLERKQLLRKQNSLQLRIPEFKERQERLNLYKEIHAGFHLLLQQKKSLEEDVSLKEKHKQQLLLKQAALLKEESENKPAWENLKSSWEKKEKLNTLLRSYNAACEIYRIQTKTETIKEEKSSLENELLTCRQQEKELGSQREKIQSEIDEKEKDLPDWEELHQMEEWFITNERLQKNRDIHKNEVKEFQKEKLELSESLRSELKPGTHSPDTESMEKLFLDLIEKKTADLNIRKQEQNEKEVRLQTEKRLIALSGELKEGQACPVCGSLDHPQPLSAGAFDKQEEALASSDRELLEIEQKLSALQKIWNRYTDGRDRINRKLPDCEKQLAEMEERLNGQLNAFLWEGHKADEPEEFQRYKRKAQSLQANLREDYQKLKILDGKLKDFHEASESVKKREQEINLELGKLSAAEATWREQLSKEHKTILPENAGMEQQRLRDHLNRLEREYPRALELKDIREKALGKTENELNTIEALLEDLNRRGAEQTESIRKALEKSGLKELQKAEQILTMNLNIEQEEKAIEHFTKERTILENRLNQLEILLADRPFKEEELLSLRNLIGEAEAERNRLTASRGAMEKQREDLNSGLKEKARSGEALKKTLIREENLKELTGLFKGKKFTEYIAAIYLQEICHRANERFFPLSGRTLELVFEENVILVRDYLNEGKTRFVKTLSGGQTFQAALSLALALAEQTGKGKDHFFFLDEGFGTLDKDTLETVMETLRQISREGRIIGLISHVEEMRQDLDVWLGISRQPEKGSRIHCSWKEGGVS